MSWKTFGLENKKCFRKEIKDLEKKFKEYCCEQSQKIGLTELKVEILKKQSLDYDLHSVYDGKAWGSSKPFHLESDDRRS